jgi:hypothetical protein
MKKLDFWMRKHWKNPACQACGGRNWMQGEIIASPLYSHGRGLIVNGPTIPMVQVVCRNCNHIMLFAAKKIFSMK